VGICLSDSRFIIGTDAYSRGSVSASTEFPFDYPKTFVLEPVAILFTFSKNNSLLPTQFKTCNKKTKKIIEQQDKGLLDNIRRVVILNDVNLGKEDK